MKSPSKLSSLLFCFLVGLTLLLCHEIMLLPDGRTHLYFLDIGQGDSELIVTPSGRRIVIDGGPDLRTLQHLGDYLPFFDRRVDLLVLTHPHIDHTASLPEIVERYHVGGLMFSGTPYVLGQYQHLTDAVAAQGIPVIVPDTGRDIVFDDGIRLSLLWPRADMFGKPFSNAHDASVTFRLTDGTHSALFTGDLEEKSENLILASGVDIRSDILKVGHHGSLTSSSTGFLLAVHPQSAVISSGKGNPFGHPRQQIVDRLRNLGIEVRRTDTEGTVEIVW